MIDAIFPEEEQDEERQYKQVLAENLVQHLTSVSHGNSLCSPDNIVNTPEHNFFHGDQPQNRKVWLWKTLFDNYFQKKNIDLVSWTWKQKFLHLLPSLPGQVSMSTGKAAALSISKQRDGSNTCISEEGNKGTSEKPDPIYSGFALISNGFHVSSEGLVFSSLEEVCAS